MLLAIGTRGLELEVAGLEGEASAEEKHKFGFLYKVPEYRASPPGSRNLPILKELYPWDGWVTNIYIIENPVNEETRSLV